MTKQKFINQWLSHFAKGVDKKSIEKYVEGKFIWHIFSFKLIDENDFLKGESAQKAYDEIDKSNCIFCDMYGANGVSDKIYNEYLSAEIIDEKIIELYIVAKDYSWTYIKTHEYDLCGPYFYKIK